MFDRVLNTPLGLLQNEILLFQATTSQNEITKFSRAMVEFSSTSQNTCPYAKSIRYN